MNSTPGSTITKVQLARGQEVRKEPLWTIFNKTFHRKYKKTINCLISQQTVKPAIFKFFVYTSKFGSSAGDKVSNEIDLSLMLQNTDLRMDVRLHQRGGMHVFTDL